MSNEIRSETPSIAAHEQWLNGQAHQQTAAVGVNAGSVAAELDSARRTLQSLRKASEDVDHANSERPSAEKERNSLFSLASERATPTKPTLAAMSPEQPSKPEVTVAEQPTVTSAHPTSTEEASNTMEMNVIVGDRYNVIGNPVYGQTIDLVSQRGDLEIIAYTDPMALAAQAVAVMGATAQAMGKDLSRQQEQLAQTVQAVAVLKQQSELMSAVQTEYRLKSDVLGVMMNQQTGELSGLLGRAQALTTGAQMS
jgi:hypothetical protein